MKVVEQKLAPISQNGSIIQMQLTLRIDALFEIFHQNSNKLR